MISSDMACWTPKSWWPERGCQLEVQCGTAYPRFSTEQDCCSRSFTGGCFQLPDTCYLPDYEAGSCVEQPGSATCKRGAWEGCACATSLGVLLAGRALGSV
jgi:hypothetical protein